MSSHEGVAREIAAAKGSNVVELGRCDLSPSVSPVFNHPLPSDVSSPWASKGGLNIGVVESGRDRELGPILNTKDLDRNQVEVDVDWSRVGWVYGESDARRGG